MVKMGYQMVVDPLVATPSPDFTDNTLTTSETLWIYLLNSLVVWILLMTSLVSNSCRGDTSNLPRVDSFQCNSLSLRMIVHCHCLQ